MQTVLIVIHLMVVLALVGVVLLQRSEGGGLGIGGGSGLMTARGASNALTRATAILAVAFFVTSLGLSILARYGEQATDVLDRVPASGSQQTPPSGQGGVLDQLGGAASAPGEQAPAAVPADPAPVSPGSAAPTGAAPAQPQGSSGTAPVEAPTQAPAAPSAPQAPIGQ